MRGSRRGERGFTLIEALVAIGIAATALVVLMGRVGASAELQRTIANHRLALDAARNLLAEEWLRPQVSLEEKEGTIEMDGRTIHWRQWTEKTFLEGFVRFNVAVRVPGEPELSLFLYEAVK